MDVDLTKYSFGEELTKQLDEKLVDAITINPRYKVTYSLPVTEESSELTEEQLKYLYKRFEDAVQVEIKEILFGDATVQPTRTVSIYGGALAGGMSIIDFNKDVT